MSLRAGLLHAEFMKLRHLAVFRAVALALLLAPVVVILVLRALASDLANIVRSPWELVLGSVVLVAAFGSVVLAAAVLGREFDQGTARAVLLRGAPRFWLLLGKIVAVLSSGCAASVVAYLLGLGETVLVGWEPTVTQAADGMAKTLVLVPLVSLSYVGVTILGGILGRSSAAGMLAGLVLFLADLLLVTLGTRILLSEWLPLTNLFSLLGGDFAFVLPAGTAPSAGVAVVRLALFGVATILAAALLFERQDVHQ